MRINFNSGRPPSGPLGKVAAAIVGALAIAASYGYEDVSACEADFVATSLAAAYEFGKNAIR